MIRDIVMWPNERLRTPSEHVDEAVGLQDAKQLAEDMVQTMLAAGGVGLAAVQIGVLQRVLVIAPVSGMTPIVMVNPVLVGFGGVAGRVSEGCLSVPGVHEEVYRYPKSIAKYTTTLGARAVAELLGRDAQCFQHEMEHLDGGIFLDRLPRRRLYQIRAEVLKKRRAAISK